MLDIQSALTCLYWIEYFIHFHLYNINKYWQITYLLVAGVQQLGSHWVHTNSGSAAVQIFLQSMRVLLAKKYFLTKHCKVWGWKSPSYMISMNSNLPCRICVNERLFPETLLFQSGGLWVVHSILSQVHRPVCPRVDGADTPPKSNHNSVRQLFTSNGSQTRIRTFTQHNRINLPRQFLSAKTASASIENV